MSEVPAATAIARGRGRFDVIDGMRRRTAYAVRTASATWVYFEGRVHVVDTDGRGRSPQRARAHGADDETALSAPMPATVVSVNVDVGQRVSRGDVLVTLEAMKMELVVRAPRDGTVDRIACRPGELVPPGTPLLGLS